MSAPWLKYLVSPLLEESSVVEDCSSECVYIIIVLIALSIIAEWAMKWFDSKGWTSGDD